jgi:hypothetical protein
VAKPLWGAKPRAHGGKDADSRRSIGAMAAAPSWESRNARTLTASSIARLTGISVKVNVGGMTIHLSEDPSGTVTNSNVNTPVEPLDFRICVLPPLLTHIG